MNSNNFSVEAHDLEKKFGSFTAVNRINFQVKKGEIFGFLGPNGAGKSTTIRMLCGILTPTSGTGQVGGYDIFRQTAQIKQNIGYMSQKFSLYDELTVEENINFYGGIYKVPNLEGEKNEIIKKAGLEGFRSKVTRTLSGGWKQKLALVCAVIHHPQIIFLDEPTSGVDPITRATFWGVIKSMAQKGKTVFVTTHYMDEAENCGRMALIYKGNIIAMGTPLEMKTKFMKNEILEIEIENSERWAEKLASSKIVKEAALFGSKIHAVVENVQQDSPVIEKLFQDGKIEKYQINKITPSLEDVFVSLIENYNKEHPDD